PIAQCQKRTIDHIIDRLVFPSLQLLVDKFLKLGSQRDFHKTTSQHIEDILSVSAPLSRFSRLHPRRFCKLPRHVGFFPADAAVLPRCSSEMPVTRGLLIDRTQ